MPQMMKTAKPMTKTRFQPKMTSLTVQLPLSQVGRIDLHVVRAEGQAEELLEDQRDAPGGEQRFERAAVEEADDAALEDDADERGHDEAERERDEKVVVERAAGEVHAGEAQGDRLTTKVGICRTTPVAKKPCTT